MPNEWIMDISDFGLIRVSNELIQNLSRFRQIAENMPESGGVLIGKHLNSGGKILIDDLTVPQAGDKQERYYYHRSRVHHDLVQKKWIDSGHIATYVGLWHTHAEPIPYYSNVDKTDWMNALNLSTYEGNSLFFFIVGQTHIRCWKGIKRLFRNKIDLVGDYAWNV